MLGNKVNELTLVLYTYSNFFNYYYIMELMWCQRDNGIWKIGCIKWFDVSVVILNVNGEEFCESKVRVWS